MRESVGNAFSSTAMKIAGAVGVLGLGEFAKESIELASNLNEAKNVTDTVFGDMSGQIEDFAQKAQSQFGVSQLAALKFSGSLGSIFKSSGIDTSKAAQMSETLTSLAGDFASFQNIDVSEAMEALQSGITGQVKPLEKFGVLVNDNTVKMYAMKNGFKGNWESASMATKEMYRYQVILQQMAHYQGDYAKTSAQFANQWRQFQDNVKNIGATVATYALPALASLVSGFNNFLTSVDVKSFMENKVIPAFKTLKTVIDAVKDNMKTIVPIVAGVVGGLAGFMIITKVTSEVRNFIKVISNISKLTNPFYLIATGIGLLIAGFVHAYNTSDDFRDRVNKLVGKLMDFGDYASGKLPGMLDALTGVFQNDLEPALDKIGKVAENIFDYVNDHWTSISTTVEIITGAVVAWKLALMAVNTWTKIVGATTAIYDTLKLAIWGVKNAATLCEGAMWLLDVAMDANPVGVVCLAIGALILVVYEVVDHFQEFVDWCYKAWDVLTNNPILMFIQTILAPWLTALEAVVTHWNEICDAIKKAYDWLTTWNGTDAQQKDLKITKTVETNTVDFDEAGYTPVVTDNSDSGHSATGTQFWKGGKTTTSEFGDEAIQLPSGSKVFTAKQSEQLLNNKGKGININFNIQGNVIGNEDFKNEVGQHVYNQIILATSNI